MAAVIAQNNFEIKKQISRSKQRQLRKSKHEIELEEKMKIQIAKMQNAKVTTNNKTASSTNNKGSSSTNNKGSSSTEVKESKDKKAVESKSGDARDTRDDKFNYDDDKRDYNDNKHGYNNNGREYEEDRPFIKWPTIIDRYGKWVDYFPRLRYIFDKYNSYIDVYEQYGYNAQEPELDRRTSYEVRTNIRKAKRCFANRAEYLRAFESLKEFVEVKELMYNALTENNLFDVEYAESMCERLAIEINSFLLYDFDVKGSGEKSGFCLYDPHSSNTIYVWRLGIKHVEVEMKKSAVDEKSADKKMTVTRISDKSEIFDFLKETSATGIKDIHDLFHVRSRGELLNCLKGYLLDGWIVYPYSEE